MKWLDKAAHFCYDSDENAVMRRSNRELYAQRTVGGCKTVGGHGEIHLGVVCLNGRGKAQ